MQNYTQVKDWIDKYTNGGAPAPRSPALQKNNPSWIRQEAEHRLHSDFLPSSAEWKGDRPWQSLTNAA